MSGHKRRAGQSAEHEVRAAPLKDEHPYRLVLLGPPGVGKGTQAKLLSSRLRACHLSTGDLFRAAKRAKQPSAAMRAALESMQRGQLVPDDVVIDMVREQTDCLQSPTGFLLDGFPRTVPQAEALDQMLHDWGIVLDGVVSFELPVERIVSRLGGRRTCIDCGAVFHLSANPPAISDICDHCGGCLIQREDDQPAAIRVRMQVYEQATRPLIDFYRQAGKLISVPAEGSPEEILDRTIELLRDHLAPAKALAASE